MIFWQLHRTDQALAECQAAGQGAGFDDRIRNACETIHQQVALSASQPGTAASASSGGVATPTPLLRLPLALAGAGGEVALKVQAMKPEEFAASKDRCDVRIGDNSFSGDLHSYKISAQIENVAVDVNLTGEVPAWRPSTGLADRQSAG